MAQLSQIDLLPSYRSHTTIEQVSSYDRTGGNDDGFSGKYSYIRKEGDKLVLADLSGPGVINRIWTATPTNDSISFYFDGEKTPRIAMKFCELFNQTKDPFMAPLADHILGGHFSYIPIPYQKSCKILFHGRKIQFIQIQYRKMPQADVESFRGNFSIQDRLTLHHTKKIWTTTHPTIDLFTTGRSSNPSIHTERFILNAGQEKVFFDTKIGGRIVGFEIDGGELFEGIHKDIILSAHWDHEKIAAIHAPIADYMGYAYGKRSMQSIVLGTIQSKNYCYLPMPFDESAQLKLIYKKRDDAQQPPLSISVKVYYNDVARIPEEEGKFYAVWKRIINPPSGCYYDFLKTKGKGHYVGTILSAQGLRPGVTLFFEGDDITEIDGKRTINGTGTEDYFNGGWYNQKGRWDRAYSTPIHGSLDYNADLYRTGGYRLFLADKMSFEKSIRHAVEHGPVGNEFPVDYTSVALFYNSEPLTELMEPTALLREVYLPDTPFLQPDTREFNTTMRPQHGDILVFDCDDDHDLDVLLAGEQRDAPFLFQGGLFKNDGKGHFTQHSCPITPGKMGTMNAADIDGDGNIDVIFNGGTNTGCMYSNGIALNNGQGMFTLGPTHQYPMPPGKITGNGFADFNNDGKMDYLCAGSYPDSYIAIYVQQANGQFIEDKTAFSNYRFINPQVQIIDYNNDGKMDVFIMAYTPSTPEGTSSQPFTGVFMNDGTGRFTLNPTFHIKQKCFGSADWNDLDGNGWLDLIIHGEGKGSSEPNDWTTRIYQNDHEKMTEIFKYERCRQFSMGGATILQDIDNDGDVDFLFGGYCDRLLPSRRQKTFVFVNNNRDETLEYEDFNEQYFLSNQYLPGMSEQDFEIADVDGDMKPDFIYQGFAEGYKDNPYHPNRVIAGWSPSPTHLSFKAHEFVPLESPQNLNATTTLQGQTYQVTFSWDAPNNIRHQQGITYNLALKDVNTGKWLYNPMAVIGGEHDGWRNINQLGNLFLNKQITLTLPLGTYEWTVQAIDAARFGGKFAPIRRLQVSTDIKNHTYEAAQITTSGQTLHIRMDSPNRTKVSIYNVMGQKVVERMFSKSFHQRLIPGLYVVEITSDKQTTRSKIIIKRN